MTRLFALFLTTLAVLTALACTTTQVATPIAPNPTLTTPRPTGQLVATAPPTNTPEPTATTLPQPTAIVVPTHAPDPTETPLPTNTPQPTPTPAPTNTPEPTATPTPTPEPVLGSRQNPVPFNQVVEILEGDIPYWAFVVTATRPDANEIVLETNPYNEHPAPGHQFYMVEFEVKYLGSSSDQFDASYRIRSLGQSGILYTTFENRCGVIPDEFPSLTELFTGGALKGWECWQVSSADVDSLTLMVDDEFSFGENRVWFSLK